MERGLCDNNVPILNMPGSVSIKQEAVGDEAPEENALYWSDIVKTFQELKYGKGVVIENREVFLLALGTFVVEKQSREAFSSLFAHDQPYGLKKAREIGWHWVHDWMLKQLNLPKRDRSERNILATFGDMMSMKSRNVHQGQPYMAAFLLIFMKTIYDLLPTNTLDPRPDFFSLFNKHLEAKETVDLIIQLNPKWLSPQLLKPSSVHLPALLASRLPNAVDLGPVEYLDTIKKKIEEQNRKTLMINELLKSDAEDIFGVEHLKTGIKKKLTDKASLESMRIEIERMYDHINQQKQEMEETIRKDKESYSDARSCVSLTKWLSGIRRKYAEDVTHEQFMKEAVPKAVVNMVKEMGKNFEETDGYDAWEAKEKLKASRKVDMVCAGRNKVRSRPARSPSSGASSDVGVEFLATPVTVTQENIPLKRRIPSLQTSKHSKKKATEDTNPSLKKVRNPHSLSVPAATVFNGIELDEKVLLGE